jgi:ribosomal protein L22
MNRELQLVQQQLPQYSSNKQKQVISLVIPQNQQEALKQLPHQLKKQKKILFHQLKEKREMRLCKRKQPQYLAQHHLPKRELPQLSLLV